MLRVQITHIEIAFWEDHVITVAKRTKEGIDKIYGWCTFASYLLFFAGVGIALVPQLLDMKTNEPK